MNHTLNWRPKFNYKKIINKFNYSPGVVLKHFRLAIGMGNGSYELYKQNSQMDMGRAVGGVFVTKNLLGPHYEIVGQACLANIHSGKTNLETVDFNILEADAKAEIRFR